jgi:hypothetical protein
MRVLPMIVMHKMDKCQLTLVAPHPQLPSQHPYIPLRIPNPTIVKDVKIVLLQHHPPPPPLHKHTPLGFSYLPLINLIGSEALLPILIYHPS